MIDNIVGRSFTSFATITVHTIYTDYSLLPHSKLLFHTLRQLNFVAQNKKLNIKFDFIRLNNQDFLLNTPSIAKGFSCR